MLNNFQLSESSVNRALTFSNRISIQVIDYFQISFCLFTGTFLAVYPYLKSL